MNNSPAKISRMVRAAALLAAIAREKSFSGAAEALGLDQSSVSHRVRELEDALEVQLFVRTTRHFRMTEEGRRLCEAAEATMTLWQETLERLERHNRSGQIRLTLPSSLAMAWLIPALPRAQQQGLDLAIDVNDEIVDLHAAENTAAIRFGIGPYPGEFATRLTDCKLVPVASPALKLAGTDFLAAAAERRLPLLADRRAREDGTDFTWDTYLERRDLTLDPALEVRSFDRADLMLQAAASGMGIGLGRSLLIENQIAAGFLEPVGPPTGSRPHYWLVTTSNFSFTEDYGKLHGWLLSEVSRTRQIKF